MDTSKEYRKMCDMAVHEIGNYEPLTPEGRQSCFYAIYKDREFTVCVSDSLCWDYPYIWLPRQDQLQGMLLRKNYNAIEIQYDFWHSFYDGDLDRHEYPDWADDGNLECIFSTPEQLWLGYIMWELYKKKWDGKQWVK